jgi:hypothetical protein
LFGINVDNVVRTNYVLKQTRGNYYVEVGTNIYIIAAVFGFADIVKILLKEPEKPQ